MASRDELSDCLQKLNINVPSESLDPLNVLSEIKKDYESIFSWEVYKKTGTRRDESNNVLEKITQKLELFFEIKGTLNFSRMCLCLINCYETFLNGEFPKAIHDVDNLIQTLENAEMNEFFKPIADICFHVVYVTKAFILAYLGDDVIQILQNIKPSSDFGRVEKAALFAIKSKVFLEYPPGGNKIALELIELARNFNETEVYWTNIWLKAKGRMRRSDRYAPTLPCREELEAANKLSSYENNLEFLLSASNVYKEAGFMLKISSIRTNIEPSNNYFKLSADLALKVYRKAENNFKLLYHCLLIYIYLPKNILLGNIYVLEAIASVLSLLENDRIHEILGKYYLKIKKDYKSAKTHLEKSSGLFSSSLQLLKVECLLHSVYGFPVVQYLNSLIEKFTSPKRRLIIIMQIILYYIFCERNAKELLHYLNIYLNEDVDYTLKKQLLVTAFPLFQLKTKFNPKYMLDVIAKEIKQLKILPLSSDNKTILENVILKFSLTCNPKNVEEKMETDLSCIICFEDGMQHVVLRPCGHQQVCKKCWETIKKEQPKCPVCRTVVTSTLIY